MPALERSTPSAAGPPGTTFDAAVRAHRQALNLLNVYPVPDGDTGTNMALTVESVVTELDETDGSIEATCRAISHGSPWVRGQLRRHPLGRILRASHRRAARAGETDRRHRAARGARPACPSWPTAP
ncbi:MAG: DAK2 domain-containing protein [Acidimicrobiia bacterium]|nr:DAK2 domain-containing protein [Acidimicrobiia bacterium]